MLSSGQEASAEAGLELLERLVAQAAGRLSVVPACGVRPALPEWLAELPKRKERIATMPVDPGAIEKFILAASRAAREGAAA